MTALPNLDGVSGNVDVKMYIPHLAGLLGIEMNPKPRWMPKWVWALKKRRKREDAIMQWEPVHYEPTDAEVKMRIAQELRDFAERILGYSDINPEKSAITRTKRRVNGDTYMRYFKYNPPKPKVISERRKKRVLRSAIRKSDKGLEAMGFKTE